jgi:hypothetical protein
MIAYIPSGRRLGGFTRVNWSAKANEIAINMAWIILLIIVIILVLG